MRAKLTVLATAIPMTAGVLPACSGKATSNDLNPAPVVHNLDDASADVQDAAQVRAEDATAVADGYVDGPSALEAGNAAIEAGDAEIADAAAEADVSVPVPCTETTTCPTAISAGTIYADGYDDKPTCAQTVYGDHSDWYTVAVEPQSGYLPNSMTAMMWLVPPPDTEVDFVIYQSGPGTTARGCSNVYTTVSGDADGAPSQIVYMTWPHVDGYPDSRLISFHVIEKPLTRCETNHKWWFRIAVT